MPSPQETEQPNSSPDPLAIGELISLAEAAELSGFDQKYLRNIADKGRLKAKKIGRNWITTIAAIEEYKASRNFNKIPKKYRQNA